MKHAEGIEVLAKYTTNLHKVMQGMSCLYKLKEFLLASDPQTSANNMQLLLK